MKIDSMGETNANQTTDRKENLGGPCNRKWLLSWNKKFVICSADMSNVMGPTFQRRFCTQWLHIS